MELNVSIYEKIYADIKHNQLILDTASYKYQNNDVNGGCMDTAVMILIRRDNTQSNMHAYDSLELTFYVISVSTTNSVAF